MQIEQISSLLGVIFIFLLILYGSYFVSKKVAKVSLRENQSKYIRLVDRMMLGQDKFIAIILIGNRYFLIGTSGDEITLLGELEQEDLQKLETPDNPLAEALNFKEILKKLGHEKEPKR